MFSDGILIAATGYAGKHQPGYEIAETLVGVESFIRIEPDFATGTANSRSYDLFTVSADHDRTRFRASTMNETAISFSLVRFPTEPLDFLAHYT